PHNAKLNINNKATVPLTKYTFQELIKKKPTRRTITTAVSTVVIRYAEPSETLRVLRTGNIVLHNPANALAIMITWMVRLRPDAVWIRSMSNSRRVFSCGVMISPGSEDYRRRTCVFSVLCCKRSKHFAVEKEPQNYTRR